MILKLDSDINLNLVKKDLINKIDSGKLNNNYSFESNLIFKIIHENSNYEDFQWILYGLQERIIERELKALLVSISFLDSSLAWDCLSIFSRYKNIISKRNKISKKYIRR